MLTRQLHGRSSALIQAVLARGGELLRICFCTCSLPIAFFATRNAFHDRRRSRAEEELEGQAALSVSSLDSVLGVGFLLLKVLSRNLRSDSLELRLLLVTYSVLVFSLR